jgi:hypothetical protein
MSEQGMFAKEPLSIGGILDAGMRAMFSTFKQTLPTAAIAAIPYALVSVIMSMQSGSLELEEDPERVMAAARNTFILLPLVYVGLTYTIACVAHNQTSLFRGQSSSISEDLLVGLKRMVPLALLMVGYVLAISVGVVLLIIPGIILLISMSLFMYVSFMENERSAWSGLGRSHTLVWRGNWWRTATVITVTSIIGMVLSLIFYVLIGALVFLQNDDYTATVPFILEGILTWALMAVYAPLFSAISLTLYNDLLIRKEGGDLQARMDEALG